MKEQLIISVNKTSTMQIVEARIGGSDVPNGCMRLSGVFGVTGVMNNNNRFYTHDNYKQMVETLQNRMKNEAVFGELEHPQSMDLTWENVTHKIEKITIDESTGVVNGTILLLDTPKGKQMQTLVREGLKLRISSRGKGVVTENNEVKLSQLETYDLVYRSGFNEAVVDNIVESYDSKGDLIFETIVKDLDAKKESTDTSALKSQLKKEIIEELKDEKSTKKDDNNYSELDLEFVEKFMSSKISDVKNRMEETFQNLLNESMIKFGRATQNWVINEFAPENVKYFNDHLKPSIMKEVLESQDKMALGIEQYMLEEFSNKLSETFKKKDDEDEDEDGVSEKLLNLADGVQKWVTEEFAVDFKSKLYNQFLLESKIESDLDKKETDEDEDEKDDEKDDNKDDGKTVSERIEERLKSVKLKSDSDRLIIESVKDPAQKLINEELIAEKRLLDAIPTSVLHLWESSSKDFKEQVLVQASQRDFVNETQIQRFWVSRFTDNSIKNINNNMVLEGKKMASNSQNALTNFAKKLQK